MVDIGAWVCFLSCLALLCLMSLQHRNDLMVVSTEASHINNQMRKESSTLPPCVLSLLKPLQKSVNALATVGLSPSSITVTGLGQVGCPEQFRDLLANTTLW